MTGEEWLTSDDVPAMLEALRSNWRGAQADLVRLTHRYLLACCRAIWGLLSMEASRRGVEVAERFLDGSADRKELGRAEYQAEGAAFYLEPDEYLPDDEDPKIREAHVQYCLERRACIELLVKEVEAVHAEELRRLGRLTAADAGVSTRQLLADAAYFVDSAMYYPFIRPRESVIHRHKKFLCSALLREIAGSLFSPRED